MDIRIEEFTPREVVCTRRVGPYQESAPAAWQALWSWAQEKGVGGDVKRVIGYGLDNPVETPPAECRYAACLELHGESKPDPERDVGVQTLSGGPYAVYCMKGPYHQMGDAFQKLCHETVPEKGLTIDPTRPCLEIYINDPTEVSESDLLTDLCIPIET